MCSSNSGPVSLSGGDSGFGIRMIMTTGTPTMPPYAIKSPQSVTVPRAGCTSLASCTTPAVWFTTMTVKLNKIKELPSNAKVLSDFFISLDPVGARTAKKPNSERLP